MTDDNQILFEREKLEHEKKHAERDFNLRERELVLKEKQTTKSATMVFFTNPVIIAIITASLGFAFDRVLKHIDNAALAENVKIKQQSDLLMKAFESDDAEIIVTKLQLLSKLKYINLTHEQQLMVTQALAQRDGELPVEASQNAKNVLDSAGKDSAGKDSVNIKDIASTKPEKPKQPKPPISNNSNKPKEVATAKQFTILIGTDILSQEAQDELKLAKIHYPNARQYRSGKFIMTVVGLYDSYENAEKELETAREKLKRPQAYIISASKVK
ncbi:MAG: hypothetical protein ACRCYO_07945 [Bacteroidia bacterium]